MEKSSSPCKPRTAAHFITDSGAVGWTPIGVFASSTMRVPRENLMRSTARTFFAFLSCVLLVSTAGCGSDSSTAATSSVVGLYDLITVDGVALPAPGKDVSGAIAGKFTSGALVLTTAGAYSSVLNYTLNNSSAGTTPGAGTYLVSGSTVTLTSSGGGTTPGAYSGGNTITFTMGLQVFVFKK